MGGGPEKDAFACEDMRSVGRRGDGSIFAGRTRDADATIWTCDGCFTDIEKREVWEVCGSVVRHSR
jgi:hypothetical protein